jgi:hypothetical protein
MKRLVLICLASAASSAAVAHNSVVPHTHPHELSILPDLSAMLVAALLVAGGVLALRMLGRKP